MLTPGAQERIWLCTTPTDMRRSFDVLTAQVRNLLRENPASGHWFVFVNRRGTMLKILSFETGVAKRYAAISRHGDGEFWFHALRNTCITVALQDLALPGSLVKRLVNHAPALDVTQDHATQWTLDQLRAPC